MVIKNVIKLIIGLCAVFLALILCYFLVFKGSPWSERAEVKTESTVMGITETVVIDKYDYIDYNNKYVPEVYILVIKGKDKDGKECKYNVRVILGTYLSSNIGDRFNMQEHKNR